MAPTRYCRITTPKSQEKIIFKNCWRIVSDQKRTTVIIQVLEATLYNERLEQLNLVYLRETNNFKIQWILYHLESLILEWVCFKMKF